MDANQYLEGSFKEVSYTVISSGSKGNAVLIGDVLVDCGIPFSKLKEHLYGVKYLLLTHSHGDHVKVSTLERIKKLFPKITIIGNHEVAYLFGVDIIANEHFPVITPDYTFHAFEVPHDVLCHGFHFDMKGLKILYCTDAAKMPEFDSDFLADIFFLESNHNGQKVFLASKSGRYGYNVIYGASRHLSTSKSKAFYLTHRRDRESPWIELHKSDRFY